MELDDSLPTVCCNCTELIKSIFVVCAECAGEPVNLCLTCFACGASMGSHERTHNYRLGNSGGVPVFGPSTAPPPVPVAESGEDKPSTSRQSLGDQWRVPWVSSEEQALLDAVERFNLGNWEAVAAAVNPKRTPEEVREHYDKFYLRGRIGAVTGKTFHRSLRDLAAVPASAKGLGGLGSPPIRPSVTRLNADDLRLLAYMPHRDDFEKEWNNEAEKSITELLLEPGQDDELDTEVKMALLDSYLRHVAERRRMKALARDYDLVPAFLKQERPQQGLKAWKYSPQQMKEMKTERELRESLKPAAQFVTAADFDALIGGLCKERLLKERIEELQSYRKKGITTLQGKRKFEMGSPVRKRRVKKRISFNSTGCSATKKWARMRRWQKKLAGGPAQ